MKEEMTPVKIKELKERLKARQKAAEQGQVITKGHEDTGL